MADMTVPATMRAWRVCHPGPVRGGPLQFDEHAAVPEPAPGELLVAVRACGVCRTDLHIAEGDLAVHRSGVTPGHEVVGEVVVAAGGFEVGDRVGIAWLRHTCGRCAYCRRGAENLCPDSRYTGWDADGGYAEFATVPAGFAHRLPDGYTDTELAPLLCAGIIGYRALMRADLPPGGRLGLYGFGGRQIRSVTSNTRADAREFLALAGRHHIEVTTPHYRLAEADRALTDLAEGRHRRGGGAGALKRCSDT